MNDPAIEKLIKACGKNNRRAQERIYRKLFPKMIAMVYRYTTDQDKALMIVNDGFLKMFKNIESYEYKGSFESWVRRLVFNSISDYFRKENKYLKFLIFEEHEKQLDDSVISKLYYEDLINLVDKLEGNTHKVFCLYAIEGFNHREIGELLNISEGTSKWHLSEARKKLKKLINRSSTINHAG